MCYMYHGNVTRIMVMLLISWQSYLYHGNPPTEKDIDVHINQQGENYVIVFVSVAGCIVGTGPIHEAMVTC